jgi:Spy/CpxP family protein refolding chaperone
MGTRWTTLLLLLAAAIAGGVVALRLDRALHRGAPQAGAPDPGHRRRPPDGRRPPFDPAARFVRELGLSPAQQARLDSLLARQRDEVQQIREETQPRYDSIAALTSREVDALLTPDQRRMLDSIKAGRPRGGRTGAHPPSSR